MLDTLRYARSQLRHRVITKTGVAYSNQFSCKLFHPRGYFIMLLKPELLSIKKQKLFHQVFAVK